MLRWVLVAVFWSVIGTMGDSEMMKEESSEESEEGDGEVGGSEAGWSAAGGSEAVMVFLWPGALRRGASVRKKIPKLAVDSRQEVH